VEIEGYKDAPGIYVVTLLDDERDELYINTFTMGAEALDTAKRLAKANPTATWSVDDDLTRT
jgi:molybdopterin-guanine dinucleotide biosynthesis protein